MMTKRDTLHPQLRACLGGIVTGVVLAGVE